MNAEFALLFHAGSTERHCSALRHCRVRSVDQQGGRCRGKASRRAVSSMHDTWMAAETKLGFLAGEASSRPSRVGRSDAPSASQLDAAAAPLRGAVSSCALTVGDCAGGADLEAFWGSLARPRAADSASPCWYSSSPASRRLVWLRWQRHWWRAALSRAISNCHSSTVDGSRVPSASRARSTGGGGGAAGWDGGRWGSSGGVDGDGWKEKHMPVLQPLSLPQLSGDAHAAPPEGWLLSGVGCRSHLASAADAPVNAMRSGTPAQATAACIWNRVTKGPQVHEFSQ